MLRRAGIADAEVLVAERLSEQGWRIEAQDCFSEAMTAAYQEQATQQGIEVAAEQAALTEALLEGRPLGDHSLW